MHPFSTLWKHQKTLRYKRVALGTNGLIDKNKHEKQKLQELVLVYSISQENLFFYHLLLFIKKIKYSAKAKPVYHVRFRNCEKKKKKISYWTQAITAHLQNK